MAQLEFHFDGQSLFVCPLQSGRTIVGRSDRCDVALPSDSVSRTHCVVERRTAGWVLTDRSKHGTLVNGQVAGQGYLLADGDELGIGEYTARFQLGRDESLKAPTSTRPAPASIHEELVAANEDHVAACRAQLRVVSGPRAGDVILLSMARTTIGGRAATVCLDPELPPNGLFVRVVRGRPMVEPGAAAVFLAGSRVRELTPALVGEEIRVGNNAFVVEVVTQEESPRAIAEFGEMIGDTPSMRRMFGVLGRVATHDYPVLLTGESGTGKELAAKGLHDAGPRHAAPFVAVNCAALSSNLVESELFGHEKGAFTGADRRSDGAFHQADGGTLFLDEVGEMRLDLQAKVLRALESGEVRRVGAKEVGYPDVRLIAATNRSLPQMVEEGTFRRDLFFRLNVLSVHLPPLRERADDVPIIARALLAKHHPGATILPSAFEALATYRWPGNARELRNVLTRAVVMHGPEIGPDALTFQEWAVDTLVPGIVVEAPERARLVQALQDSNGNRTQAARVLGMPRSSLLYKLKKYGISVAKG
jgi:transcriptional regulator with AAA-type ATPase domain